MGVVRYSYHAWVYVDAICDEAEPWSSSSLSFLLLLLRTQDPEDSRGSVVRLRHGVEEVRDHGGAQVSCLAHLRVGCGGVADGGDDAATVQGRDNRVRFVKFGGDCDHFDCGWVVSCYRVHVL